MYNFWRSTTFILVIWSSKIVVVTLLKNLLYLLVSGNYMRYRFYEQRYYHFVEWRKDKNKSCTVEKLYNFVVEIFLIWIIYCFKIWFEFLFVECFFSSTRRRPFLPSAKKNSRQTLGKKLSSKTFFTEKRHDSVITLLCAKEKHTAKRFFVVCSTESTRKLPGTRQRAGFR